MYYRNKIKFGDTYYNTDVSLSYFKWEYMEPRTPSPLTVLLLHLWPQTTLNYLNCLLSETKKQWGIFMSLGFNNLPPSCLLLSLRPCTPRGAARAPNGCHATPASRQVPCQHRVAILPHGPAPPLLGWEPLSPKSEFSKGWGCCKVVGPAWKSFPWQSYGPLWGKV